MLGADSRRVPPLLRRRSETRVARRFVVVVRHDEEFTLDRFALSHQHSLIGLVWKQLEIPEKSFVRYCAL